MKTLNTESDMQPFEYIFFFISYFIQYGWGVWNLYLSYNWRHKDERLDAGLYIVVNLIVIPFITSCVSAILKYVDTKGKITRFLIVQSVMTLIQGIAMLVCALIFMTAVQGTIIACVIGVLTFIAWQLWIYSKNDFYMPKFWSIFNLVIVTIAILAPLVASFFLKALPIFTGFSISMWILSGILIIYGYGRVLNDYRNI